MRLGRKTEVRRRKKEGARGLSEGEMRRGGDEARKISGNLRDLRENLKSEDGNKLFS